MELLPSFFYQVFSLRSLGVPINHHYGFQAGHPPTTRHISTIPIGDLGCCAALSTQPAPRRSRCQDPRRCSASIRMGSRCREKGPLSTRWHNASIDIGTHCRGSGTASLQSHDHRYVYWQGYLSNPTLRGSVGREFA